MEDERIVELYCQRNENAITETAAKFLGKITRRISIDRWRMRNTEKRGPHTETDYPAAII